MNSNVLNPNSDSPQVGDVLVVGAGIIGLACAHYLSSRGLHVRIVDRGRMAGGCSHGNCGYICPSHVLPLTEPAAIRVALKSLIDRHAPFRVRPRASWKLLWWFIQFARRCNHRQMLTAGRHLQKLLDSSISEYRTLMSHHHLEAEWGETGLLYVLRTAKGLDEFAATAELLEREFDVVASRLSGAELAEFDAALRPGLAGGFHYPHDAMVRPDRLAASWCEMLRRQGVQLIEDCEVHQVHRNNQQITAVSTAHGQLEAQQFVFATGAWSPKFERQLNCRLPVEPGKGYSITMRRPAICPRVPMLFPEHRVGVTPFSDAYRLGSMMEFAGYDTSIPEQRMQQLRRAAEPYLVEPHTPEVLERWYGWRPMTWDSLPVIGRVPGLRNGWLATGHNMLGLSLAPGTGRLLAELLCGEHPHLDPVPYSAERF